MSLKQIVGQKTYEVWVEMLGQLVPQGRTHRLAPLVAGMLQYASDIAYQKYGDDFDEGSVAQPLSIRLPLKYLHKSIVQNVQIVVNKSEPSWIRMTSQNLLWGSRCLCLN